MLVDGGSRRALDSSPGVVDLEVTLHETRVIFLLVQPEAEVTVGLDPLYDIVLVPDQSWIEKIACRDCGRGRDGRSWAA